MKYLFMLSACISVIAGAVFYLMSDNALMALIPAAVAFVPLIVNALTVNMMMEDETESEEEDYSAYQKAHGF